MRRKININEKKLIQGLFVFCSLLVILLSIIGDKGFMQLHRLKQTESLLIHELKELRKERRIWLKKIESIRGNRTYLETYAREQLGMVGNHETLLKLVPEEDEQ